MAKRWLDLLPSKEQDWRILEGMVQALGELTGEVETLHFQKSSNLNFIFLPEHNKYSFPLFILTLLLFKLTI
jgi:hypothetical protein